MCCTPSDDSNFYDNEHIFSNLLPDALRRTESLAYIRTSFWSVKNTVCVETISHIYHFKFEHQTSSKNDNATFKSDVHIQKFV